MIEDNNPYAPPKSTFDFGQPENVLLSTKKQRVVRIVLGTFLQAILVGLSFVVIMLLVAFVFYRIVFYDLITKPNSFFISIYIISTSVIIQSFVFSIITEYYKYKNIFKYSFLMGILFYIAVNLPDILSAVFLGKAYTTHDFTIIGVSKILIELFACILATWITVRLLHVHRLHCHRLLLFQAA